MDLFCGFVGNVAGVDNSPTNGVGDGDEAVDKGTCHCLLEADLGDCGAEMGFGIRDGIMERDDVLGWLALFGLRWGIN